MEKSIIMEQNRHMFIYGPNGLDRQIFLQQLESEYPIKTNVYSPIGIYVKDLKLPIIENNGIDKTKLGILTRDYLINSIAYQMIENIHNQSVIELLGNKAKELSYWIEKYIDCDKCDIKQLLSALKTCKDIYYEAYIKYLELSKIHIDFDKLPISYLDIEKFARELKNILNNKAYFDIIIDQQEQFPLELQQAINWLVTKRINGSVSMKVFCEREQWKTTYDLNGEIMDYCHDYGTHEINDFSKIIKL